MVKRRGSLRPLVFAVCLTVFMVVPVGFVLLREGEPARSGGGEALSSSTTKAPEGEGQHSKGIELAPPPPAQRPSAREARLTAPPRAPEPATAAQAELKKPRKPPSVRLVAIARLERKRPNETITLAEELVRDIAGDPSERTVLLGALGVLHRVGGGEAALVRLSDDPPNEEVGRLASEYLMRPKTQ